MLLQIILPHHLVDMVGHREIQKNLEMLKEGSSQLWHLYQDSLVTVSG